MSLYVFTGAVHGRPAPHFIVTKEKRRSRAPQNDIDDINDINLAMGAVVKSVVTDVTIVTLCQYVIPPVSPFHTNK